MGTSPKTQVIGCPVSRSGFTLLEILVVVAIISLLVGLLLPAIRKVRERADEAACASNLRQIGLAILAYHNDYNQLPIGWAGEDFTWNSSLKGYLPTYEAGGNFNRIRIKLACPSIPRTDEFHYNYMYNDNLFFKNLGSLIRAAKRPIVTDAENVAANLNLTDNVKEVHRGGANYLYLDGHVDWKEDPDEEAWQGTGAEYQ